MGSNDNNVRRDLMSYLAVKLRLNRKTGFNIDMGLNINQSKHMH